MTTGLESWVDEFKRRRFKVLCIEDQTEYFEILQRCQKQFADPGKFELSLVTTCADGLDAILRGTADMYLIDWRLPDGDGIALIKMVREKGVNDPIIVLTGYRNPTAEDEARESGADFFLDKSDLTVTLFERVLRYNCWKIPYKRILSEMKGELHAPVAGYSELKGD